MKNFILLTRALSKNSGEMEMPKSGRRKKAYKVLGGLALACIMIPCCIIVGYIVYIMTEAMLEGGGNTEGLALIVQLMNVFAVIFSVMVLFNVLYFSSDLDHLLPLPIKPGELVAAKFTNVYFAESVMEFMILFSGFTGYFAGAGIKPVSLLTAALGVFLIPILPLVYCGIFSLLIMAFFSKIRLLKNVDFVVGIFTIAFAGLFVLSFIQMDSVTLTGYINGMVEGSNIFIKIMNGVFFTIPVFLKAVESNSILFMLLFILINAAAVLVLILFGNKLYLRGVHLVSSAEKSGKKKTGKEAPGAFAEKKVWKSYLQKECRMLNRTPVYRKYCSGVNIIWPILMAALFILPATKDFMTSFEKLFNVGYVATDMILLLFVIAVSAFATAMNSIASSSFTREGAHFEFIKYTPVDLKTLIKVKAMTSMLYSGGAVVSAIIVLFGFMRFSVARLIYFIIIGLLVTLLCTFIGIMLDSSNPKLTWEDEYGALRGNLNVFFNMAIAILLALVLCIGGVVLFKYTAFRTGIIYFIYLVLLIITDWRIINISTRITIHNISNQD